jgi:hypothetical protein
MGSMSAERSILWAAASTSIPFNEATRTPASTKGVEICNWFLRVATLNQRTD